MKPLNWIETKDLRKKYGKNEILRGIDLEVGNGINLLVGRNGAGKSTLISILAGLTLETSGFASILGLNPVKQSRDIMKHVYFTPESPVFFHSQIVEDFLYAHMNLNGYRKEELYYFLDTFNVRSIVHSYFQSLSMGERELVMDAAALATGKAYYVLDEPNSNIDSSNRAILADEIKKIAIRNNSSFLIITHIMDNILNISDHLYSIAGGRIAGPFTAEEAMRNPSNLCIKIRAFSLENLKKSLSDLNLIISGQEARIRGITMENLFSRLSVEELNSITSIEISVGDAWE